MPMRLTPYEVAELPRRRRPFLLRLAAFLIAAAPLILFLVGVALGFVWMFTPGAGR